METNPARPGPCRKCFQIHGGALASLTPSRAHADRWHYGSPMGKRGGQGELGEDLVDVAKDFESAHSHAPWDEKSLRQLGPKAVPGCNLKSRGMLPCRRLANVPKHSLNQCNHTFSFKGFKLLAYFLLDAAITP